MADFLLLSVGKNCSCALFIFPRKRASSFIAASTAVSSFGDSLYIPIEAPMVFVGKLSSPMVRKWRLPESGSKILMAGMRAMHE